MSTATFPFFSFPVTILMVAFFLPAVCVADEAAPYAVFGAVQTEKQKKNADDLLANLQAEKRRQMVLMNQLQESIRTKTRLAASQGITEVQGESLKRDVLLTDAKLRTLKAELKAVQERIDHPDDIPIAVLLHHDPEMSQLADQRVALQAARNARAATIAEPAKDARIQQLDRQISELETKLEKSADSIDSDKIQAIKARFRTQEELNKHELLQQIRVQEILVADLTKKYNEQQTTNIERSTDAVDVSFEQAHLKRVNKTLEQIDNRMIALQVQLAGDTNLTGKTSDDSSVQNQLRRINERLDQLEGLLRALQPYHVQPGIP